MARTGRPKAVINYELVKDLSMIQCTQEEIANILGLAVRTLQNDDEFMRIYKIGMDEGKKSLRRQMFQTALKGNPTMLIWLSKQYLGMREPKQDISLDTNQDVVNEIKALTDKI
jgi:hypothetical protein